MSLHVEWLTAKTTGVELTPMRTQIGEDVVEDGNHAIVLNYDEAVVIEGTLAELSTFAERIRDLVKAEYARSLPELAPPPDAEDGDDVEATCQHVWTAEEVAAIEQSNADYVAKMRAMHGDAANLYPRTVPEVGSVCGSYLLMWELEPMYRSLSWRGGVLRAGDSKFGDSGQDDSLVCSDHQHEWAYPEDIDYV